MLPRRARHRGDARCRRSGVRGADGSPRQPPRRHRRFRALFDAQCATPPPHPGPLRRVGVPLGQASGRPVHERRSTGDLGGHGGALDGTADRSTHRIVLVVADRPRPWGRVAGGARREWGHRPRSRPRARRSRCHADYRRTNHVVVRAPRGPGRPARRVTAPIPRHGGPPGDGQARPALGSIRTRARDLQGRLGPRRPRPVACARNVSAP